jgi:hypothetical protein
MLILGSTYMEIENTSETGKCSLYSQTVDSSVKLSDAMIAAALAKGISIDDIKKQEAESTRQAKATIGLNGTCKFNTSSLFSLLSRWKAGNYSSSDVVGADCSGKLYGSNAPQSGSYPSNSTAKGANGTNYTFNSSLNASNGNPGVGAGNANASVKTNSSTSKTANITMTNSTPGATSANATATTPKANATGPANASSISANFSYSAKYNTYYPERLAWFCNDRGTEFYRMHWKEYFGGDCNVPKPKEGYVSLGDYTATGCAMLPCCINGPYNEYSRSYDYFECGFN